MRDLTVALSILTAVEFLTHFLNAVFNEPLAIKTYLRGILKYIYMFALLIASAYIDKYILSGINGLFYSTAMFYISLETVEIVNNAYNMGVPVPKKLMQAVKILMTASNGGKEDENENINNSL